ARQANGSCSGAPRWRAMAARRACRVPAPSVAKYKTPPGRLIRYCPAKGSDVITDTDRSSAAVVLKLPHWPLTMPTPLSGSSCFTHQRCGFTSACLEYFPPGGLLVAPSPCPEAVGFSSPRAFGLPLFSPPFGPSGSRKRPVVALGLQPRT